MIGESKVELGSEAGLKGQRMGWDPDRNGGVWSL